MTEASALPPAPEPAAAPCDLSRRPLPPLQEVLAGLEARELEGQTVFDQFFGAPPLPAGSAPD